MHNDGDHDDWGPAHRAGFDALARERQPPAELEKEVLSALRRQGLIQTIAPRVVRLALAVAAASLFFVVGMASNRWLLMDSTQPGVHVDMNSEQPTFMLMLYRSPESLAQASSSSRETEYAKWARMHGSVVGGEELGRVREWLPRLSTEPTVPPAHEYPNDLVLVGYFLVETSNMAAARAIADACPHRTEGPIEIRRIQGA